MTTPALPFWPRLLSREQAARYCGISADTFDGLVERGAVPKSVSLPGVRRTLWDRGRLDDALDRLVGGIHEASDGGREARKANWKARHEGGSEGAGRRQRPRVPLSAQGGAASSRG